jgi:hypothetical protein
MTEPANARDATMLEKCMMIRACQYKKSMSTTNYSSSAQMYIQYIVQRLFYN